MGAGTLVLRRTAERIEQAREDGLGNGGAAVRHAAFDVEVARIDGAANSLGLRFVGLDLANYRVIERLAIGRPVVPMR